MIEEAYCNYDIVKLLEEKGFDFSKEPLITETSRSIDSYVYYTCTHQTAMRWLREIHGIDIIIEISDPSVKDRKYYCMIWDGNNNSYILDLFNSYEEACEAAIKYVLENLI